MMFFGSFEHAVDDKGRIIMPSRFRSKLEEGVVMARWLEQCVAVFPRNEFEKMAERIQALPEGSAEKREFSRVFFGHAYEAMPDRQGRLTIPPKLREIAGLDRDVEAELVAKAKAIDHGLGEVEDANLDAVEHSGLDALGQRHV